MYDIAVIGAGYVGLTTAVCLAELGHAVVCADVDEDRVQLLLDGQSPILEPGMNDLIARGAANGRLRVTTDNTDAVRSAEFVFLCVPTPEQPNGAADLSFVKAACIDIGPALSDRAIVINKSTVPIGSAHLVNEFLARDDVNVVSNPEFLREGSAIHEFMNPDRIVIGADDRAAGERVAALYDKLDAPVVITDPTSAETIKYAANAYLATRLSFVNAIAAVCEAVGADVHDVVQGMGYDQRIGHDFMRPGPGWGGSCFPKDTRALIHIADEAGYSFDFLKGVVDANDQQFARIADKVRGLAGGDLDGARVAVWGLTFKAGTDDLRGSPSLSIIDRLIEAGAFVTAYDPAAEASHPWLAERDLTIVDDAVDAVDGADVLAVLTEWPEFREVDLFMVASKMARPTVIDARDVLDVAELERQGFAVERIGTRSRR